MSNAHELSGPMSTKKRANEGDLADRIRGVIEAGIKALERQVRALTKPLPKDADESTVARHARQLDRALATCATMLGHVRRYDQAQADAGRRLAPAAVLEFLRSLSPELRARLLSEFSEFGGEAEETSVLS